MPTGRVTLYRTYGHALLAAGRAAEAADKLAPLLSAGPDGRAAWLGLAGAHKSADAARAWVEGCDDGRRDAPPDQRLAVAVAYFDAGRATADARVARPGGRRRRTAGGRRRPAGVRPCPAGNVAHYLGDYAKAEQSWRLVRRAVANPDPDVLNNLAYVLLVKGDPKDVAEATQLAEQAAAAEPASLAYAGTLALAKSRGGDRPAAIAGYRRVLAKDADNVEALLGLAGELLKGGTPPEQSEGKRLVTRPVGWSGRGRCTRRRSAGNWTRWRPRRERPRPGSDRTPPTRRGI